VAQEEVLSTAPSGKQHSAVPRGSETVLVVEDDPAVRRVACEILRSLGYNVLEAGCPKKARELIELHASGIRGVLTDIVMPGGGGRELAQDLVDSHPGLKVVIMSGYDESSQPDRSSSPAFPFLHKPFTPRALAEKMREVLDR
ncbi:MAG TPA: response regulator, partial [Planctomycetota bacterium]|nr:response regulator [Planctomycetota bacterium]